MKSSESVCREIQQFLPEILAELNQEAIDVYLYLQSEINKAKVTKNHIFQFVYRSFYRLDRARLSLEQKKKFFELMERNPRHLKVVLEELHKLPTSKGKKSYQFSFATKLLHSLDTSLPLYDRYVGKALGVSLPHGKKNRMQEYQQTYEKMKVLFRELKEKLQLPENEICIVEFKKRFKRTDSLSVVKILDFLLWGYGRYLVKKTTKNR